MDPDDFDEFYSYYDDDCCPDCGDPCCFDEDCLCDLDYEDDDPPGYCLFCGLKNCIGDCED